VCLSVSVSAALSLSLVQGESGGAGSAHVAQEASRRKEEKAFLKHPEGREREGEREEDSEV